MQVMVSVVVATVCMALTTLIVTAGMVAFVVHRLRVRNRVVRSVRSPAPLRWLVSPRWAARLHRRLQATVDVAHLAQRHRETLGLGLDDVVAELASRAVELDRQLVIADHAPRGVRVRLLRELSAEVRELEAIAERTVRMARAFAGDRPSERGLGPVRERLDALEAAIRELDAIDALPVLRRTDDSSNSSTRRRAADA
jgi:hypothetical protein